MGRGMCWIQRQGRRRGFDGVGGGSTDRNSNGMCAGDFEWCGLAVRLIYIVERAQIFKTKAHNINAARKPNHHSRVCEAPRQPALRLFPEDSLISLLG